jgi:glycosyltransferase involved in cell wall biosynthesis
VSVAGRDDWAESTAGAWLANGGEPLVAVLVPVHNGAAYLQECLESVLRQTYGNWRLIVGDNRSTDGSDIIARGFAERDPRVQITEFDEFAAQVDNWNRVQDLVPPDAVYVKWLCADDWLYPECLSRMVDIAERHPSAALIGGYRVDDRFVNLDGLPVDRVLFDGRALAEASLLGSVDYVFGSHTSIMGRHGVVKRRPFWHPDYLHFDLELCYEILRQGDFGFVPQVMTYTRRHNESVTSRVGSGATVRAERVKILLEHGPYFLTPEQLERRLFVCSVQYVRAMLRGLPRWRDERFRRTQIGLLRQLMARIDPKALGRGLGRQVVRTLLRPQGPRPRAGPAGGADPASTPRP